MRIRVRLVLKTPLAGGTAELVRAALAKVAARLMAGRQELPLQRVEVREPERVHVEGGGAMGRKKLGETLCDRQHITRIDLEEAIQEQAQNGATLLGEILLRQGKVHRQDLIVALEEATRANYVDCSSMVLEPDAIALLSHAAAKRYCALPLQIEHKVLHIAIAEPQNLSALDELRFLTGMALRPFLGFRAEIVAGIAKAYETVVVNEEDWIADGERVEFLSTSSSESHQLALKEFQEELRGERTPAVRLVSNIIRTAVVKKASDIHVEQAANEAVVRIRVDGVLRELLRVPTELRMQLVSRIKILADLDIAERRISQDGRFLAAMGGRQVDLRVSTLPTQFGEKIVVRLLDSAAATVPFEELGFAPQNAAQLYKLLAAPQGMMLVTGPTGSGKSTTLYSALNFLKSPGINITTIEDPVEYVIEGVNQVQINPKAGRTFASCLRSMLRQDPNVVMLGEVRDGQTAEIALTAAQTGHLVLSTLHTNDSVSAITRLLDLQVPAFLIASSVTAVIAQRLVRKLCSCREEVRVTREYAFRMRGAGFDGFGDTTYVPVGCQDCEQTGYKGRIGIYELLVLNEMLRAAIRDGARDNDVRSLARTVGFQPMREDARSKIEMGVTTLDEVLRVVPLQDEELLTCNECAQFLWAKFQYCPQCGTKVPDDLGDPTVKMPANW